MGTPPKYFQNYRSVIFEHTFEHPTPSRILARVTPKPPLVYQSNVKHSWLVEYQEALAHIGQLVRAGRLSMGYAQKPFAEFAGFDLKTLRTLEKGERAPWDTTQTKVEKALGWRQGVIKEVLDHYEVIPITSITPEYLTEGAEEATWADLSAEEDDKTKPVSRAGLLTNEELIGELAYRLRHKSRGIAGAFLP